MATSAKPRRARVEREANVPITCETARRLALEIRLAVEALIGAPSPAAYNQLSKMLAALKAAGMQGEPLETATATMNAICDRYERVGKVGLKDAEAEALRTDVALIEQALPILPLNVFARAVAQVEVFCAVMGA
ncbi:hypothetical protein [Massilia endophytica]|uniref:hypothetical protein n=1 Tax=Massilia endophytica TaxID=2899220 RepID=UPI001E4076CF|nr:hypothetical protein [Massilia endophytica]UGQ45105.1 hypothetical protein LSQ66_15030 [Massilia endophytica]